MLTSLLFLPSVPWYFYLGLRYGILFQQAMWLLFGQPVSNGLIWRSCSKLSWIYKNRSKDKIDITWIAVGQISQVVAILKWHHWFLILCYLIYACLDACESVVISTTNPFTRPVWWCFRSFQHLIILQSWKYSEVRLHDVMLTICWTCMLDGVP